MSKWLSREVVRLPLYYCLCVSEKDFNKDLKRLKVKTKPTFVSRGAWATCHFLESDKGSDCVFVCIDTKRKATLPEVYSALVHEAVHVWQHSCALMGEDKAGQEMEAYGIQSISLALMNSYNKQTKRKV